MFGLPPQLVFPAPDSDGTDALQTRELLEQARDGHHGAWEVIYNRYRMRLLLDAGKQLRGRPIGAHGTEDIVQSAFLAAWDTIRRFEYRGEGSFRAWLRKLVVNRAIARLRARATEGDHYEVVSDAQLANVRDEGLDPGAAAEQADEVRRVLECLERLPEMERDIVLLRSFERKPWTQVAECCERSVRFVEDRYKLAFKRLALCLAGNHGSTAPPPSPASRDDDFDENGSSDDGSPRA